MSRKRWEKLLGKCKPITKERAKRMFENPSPGERAMWAALRWRNKRYDPGAGPRWKCQVPVRGFIADFYCAYLHAVIEVDGKQHRKPEAVAYDRRRDGVFASIGIRVIRVPWPFDKHVDDILNDLLGPASALPENRPQQVFLSRRGVRAQAPAPSAPKMEKP